MKKTALLLSLPILLSLVEPAASADTRSCTTRSGPGTTALLELYTSEGCSSCPPAERWLNSLAPGGFAPGQVIPLALHVDYWNYLGWRDPFSQKRFTERQVNYKSLAGARGVYTPQMFLNGREYLGWYRHEDLARTLEPINREAGRAGIQLRLGTANPGSLDVTAEITLRDPGAHQRAGVYLALTENHLASRVSAGENRGEHLQHNHVVRVLDGPRPVNPDGRVTVTQRFALADGWKREDLGVVAFVQDRASGEILQTLALANCR